MKQLDQSKPVYDELTRLLQTIPSQMKVANDSAVNACTNQMNHDIQRDLKALQVNLAKTIRDNVKNEVTLYRILCSENNLFINYNFIFVRS